MEPVRVILILNGVVMLTQFCIISIQRWVIKVQRKMHYEIHNKMVERLSADAQREVEIVMQLIEQESKEEQKKARNDLKKKLGL